MAASLQQQWRRTVQRCDTGCRSQELAYPTFTLLVSTSLFAPPIQSPVPLPTIKACAARITQKSTNASRCGSALWCTSVLQRHKSCWRHGRIGNIQTDGLDVLGEPDMLVAEMIARLKPPTCPAYGGKKSSEVALSVFARRTLRELGCPVAL